MRWGEGVWSREPHLVLPHAVREARRDEHIAPIHLRQADRALERSEVPAAQLEHRERDTLEPLRVDIEPTGAGCQRTA